MAYYISHSDSYYAKRWGNSPHHLTWRNAMPPRGATGTALCGTDVRVAEDEYEARKHVYKHICKKCEKARARADSA